MYDVVVVGAGVAGSYIASKLDAEVLVLEKDSRSVIKDSGIVSSDFNNFFKDKALIKNKISEMQFISPSGKSFILGSDEPFAYILKRKDFAQRLRNQARKNAEIRFEKVNNINHLANALEVCTENGTYECKLVVGADGASSTVRKSLDITDPLLYAGIFTRTRQTLDADKIKIFFNKYFSPDFFSWLIPQNNEYGIVTAVRPNEYFNYFKKKLELPEGDTHSSLIPVGCTKSYSSRAILVGDACGQTKPLTGGGIIFSLTSAEHAVKIIDEACKTKRFDEDFLRQYEILWKSEIGAEIRKQMILRRIYRKLTNAEIDSLFKDFGPTIENIRDFSYDMFSNSWRELPKIKLLKFLLSNLGKFI